MSGYIHIFQVTFHLSVLKIQNISGHILSDCSCYLTLPFCTPSPLYIFHTEESRKSWENTEPLWEMNLCRGRAMIAYWIDKNLTEAEEYLVKALNVI